jgi:hypothetical protein
MFAAMCVVILCGIATWISLHVYTTHTRGEYVPSTMEVRLSPYQVYFAPEWATYGGTCTYTRFGTHAWELDARVVEQLEVWSLHTRLRTMREARV